MTIMIREITRMFRVVTEDDEADGDGGDQALEVEGGRAFCFCSIQLAAMKSSALFEFGGNIARCVNVVDFELDYGKWSPRPARR